VDLSDKGRTEARAAGELLKKEGFSFDVAYASVLKRALNTLWSVLQELDIVWIPIEKDWRLNERHYGALQGLNKSETEKSSSGAAATTSPRPRSRNPTSAGPATTRATPGSQTSRSPNA